MKKWITLMLSVLLIMSGCSKEEKNNTTSNNTDSNNKVADTKMFSDYDLDSSYDNKNAVFIDLSKKIASSDSVKISNSTFSITEEATYILSGVLNDGMILVDSNEKAKIKLVLDNVTITNSKCAAIYVLKADKVCITLAEKSNNTINNGGSFTSTDENNIDGAIFSKQDLTFNGTGSLTISSPAGHGIVCKDDLVFTGGDYIINASSHALDANDSIRTTNASFLITCGKDGFHAENNENDSLGFIYIQDGTFDIEAQGDGISSLSYMKILNGNFTICTGGGSVNSLQQSSDSWGGYNERIPGGGRGPQRPGESNREQSSDESTDSSTSIKAIKSSGIMNIENGTFIIDSADDSIHSNTSIIVNGGTFDISSGDDGFHADESLKIKAGIINISKSYEGLEALDIEINGGDITLYSSDDGLNAAGGVDESGYGGERRPDQFSSSGNGSIVINSGNLYMNASGDGIDANGTFIMNDGYVIVCGPTQGDTATLDYDISAEINGGTFIGTGARGMAQTFSQSSTQGVYALQVGNISAKTSFTISDNSGNEVIKFAPDLNYSVIIVSTPDIKKGSSYTITIKEASGTFEAY